VFALNAVRLGVLAALQHTDAALRNSRLTLKILVGFAFVSGCLWAVIPFLDASHDSYAARAYVIFIIAGICAGAVIQSPAFSRVAIAFGAPQMASGIVSLLAADRRSRSSSHSTSPC
jgi:hypothetical protein